MQLVYGLISVYLCSVIISVFTYYLHEFTIYYCIYLLFVYVLSGHKSSALRYLNYLHGSTKITCMVAPKLLALHYLNPEALPNQLRNYACVFPPIGFISSYR